MYTKIVAQVFDQTLRVTNIPKLASGGENEVRVEVTFDTLWTGFGKTAIFYRENKKNQVYHVVMKADSCLIPREVLVEPGVVCFGILGTSGSTVRTTEVVALTVAQGAITGTVGAPLPDVYKQIASAYGSVATEVAVERARIDNLIANGGATADAELVDIRVGANGVTYPTAGDAVREQLGALNGDVRALTNAYAVEPPFAFGYRWIDEQGVVHEDSNYAVTRVIDLSGCAAIRFRLYQYNNAETDTHLSMLAYYDQNLNHIESLTTVEADNGIVESVTVPPADAKYAIACLYKPMGGGYVRFFYTPENLVDGESMTRVVNLCDNAVESGYIRTDGVVIDDANWVHTGYIPVSPGESLELSMHGHTAVNSVTYYDRDKKIIGNLVANIEYILGTTEKHLYGVKVVPPRTEYIRLCYRINADTVSRCKYKVRTLDAREQAQLNSEEIADLRARVAVLNQSAEKPLTGKRVFLAGDSRSSTDYDFYGSTLSEKSGASVTVGGASGWSTAAIASDEYFARLKDAVHDFSIWLVGGNDTGEAGTVGTFSASSPNGVTGEQVVTETDISVDYAGNTFVQAVDHIMRKYKATFYDWRTLSGGVKPRMIFCTDIPQKRSGGALTWSLPENWERKRQAILECCAKNGVHCLDLLDLCGFDMSYEPEWVSPTDKVNNNGLYFMDGLHPNKYGVDIITSLEIEEIKRYLTVH